VASDLKVWAFTRTAVSESTIIRAIHNLQGYRMARDDHPEPTAGQSQPDLFGGEPVPVYRPDPDKVRS
jgi:hypothetical protein